MTGVVFVKVADRDSSDQISSRVVEGMERVPEGRCLVATWTNELPVQGALPVEASVVDAVLGSPEQRSTEESEWMFFGNGAARLFRPGRLEEPFGIQSWVAFRRAGEKAYSRRKTSSPSTLDESRIEVTSPVFTRDVANNVWHFEEGAGSENVLRRLFGLFAWADETALVIDDEGQRRWRSATRDYSADLVGVPTKEPYTWSALNLFDS